MNNTVKFSRHAASVLVLALLGFMSATNVLADNYRAKIKKIASDSATGDIIIHVVPGKNEKKFSGKARVILIGIDSATNRVMATLLTAVSLNAEVIINVANPPSNDDVQVTTKVTLIAP